MSIDMENWTPVRMRLPSGEDAVSCEAWCEATEDWPAGPCIMTYLPEEVEGERWNSREDTGCWEPGPVTHWRPRPNAPMNPTTSEPNAMCRGES